MGNCWSCLGRTIRNDRQEEPSQFTLRRNRSPPLARRNESVQSKGQVPVEQPSTSADHEPPPQTAGDELSVVKLTSSYESIQSKEEVPVDQQLPSTSSEHELPIHQTTGGESSVVNVNYLCATITR